jgi:hypothetical protein
MRPREISRIKMLQSGGSGQVSLIKKNLGHEPGSDRSGPGRVKFRVEHYRFFSSLGSFRVRFQVLINLGHLGFRVIRVQVWSGFRLSDVR